MVSDKKDFFDRDIKIENTNLKFSENDDKIGITWIDKINEPDERLWFKFYNCPDKHIKANELKNILKNDNIIAVPYGSGKLLMNIEISENSVNLNLKKAPENNVIKHILGIILYYGIEYLKNKEEHNLNNLKLPKNYGIKIQEEPIYLNLEHFKDYFLSSIENRPLWDSPDEMPCKDYMENRRLITRYLFFQNDLNWEQMNRELLHNKIDPLLFQSTLLFYGLNSTLKSTESFIRQAIKNTLSITGFRDAGITLSEEDWFVYNAKILSLNTGNIYESISEFIEKEGAHLKINLNEENTYSQLLARELISKYLAGIIKCEALDKFFENLELKDKILVIWAIKNTKLKTSSYSFSETDEKRRFKLPVIIAIKNSHSYKSHWIKLTIDTNYVKFEATPTLIRSILQFCRGEAE